MMDNYEYCDGNWYCFGCGVLIMPPESSYDVYCPDCKREMHEMRELQRQQREREHRERMANRSLFERIRDLFR